MGPRADGDGVGTEETRSRLCRRFNALTGGAGVDVGADGAGHTGPPELGGDGVQGFEEARVTGGGGVMEFMEEAETKGRVIGDANAVTEVPYVVTALKEAGTAGITGLVEGIGGVGGFDVMKDGISEDDMSGKKVVQDVEEGGGDGRRGAEGVKTG